MSDKFLVPRFCFCLFEVWRCFCPLIDCCLQVGGGLLVMGFYVECAWRCCYEVCEWCISSRFALSLFYLCTFQMNQVCVVCVVTSD